MRTSVLIGFSLALHIGGFAFISQKAKQIEKKQTLIAMVDQKKKEEEKKKEPPKPIEAPKEILQAKAKVAPPPVATPPPEPVSNQPSSAMQALPDFGLNLGGGAGGGGGTMAVPENKGGQPGGKATEGPRGPTEKALTTAPKGGAAANADLAAEIAAWKPKPTARVKPVYPDEARSSEIEGTVTVEAIVDCSGKVSSAKVIQGLGHGLDQAAITAIQKTEFEPAPRCAPGFQKAMKINYAFRLGD